MQRWESAVCLHCESHRSDFLCGMLQCVLSRRGDAGPSGLPWVQPGWGRQSVTGLTKEKFSLRCFKHQHHILPFESIFKSWLIKTVELQGSDWSCVRFLGPVNRTLLIIPVIWWACLRGSGLLASISTRGGEGVCLSPAVHWCHASSGDSISLHHSTFLFFPPERSETFPSLFIPTSFCIKKCPKGSLDICFYSNQQRFQIRKRVDFLKTEGK